MLGAPTYGQFCYEEISLKVFEFLNIFFQVKVLLFAAAFGDGGINWNESWNRRTEWNGRSRFPGLILQLSLTHQRETRGKMAGPTWQTRGKMAGPSCETRGKMAGPTCGTLKLEERWPGRHVKLEERWTGRHVKQEERWLGRLVKLEERWPGRHVKLEERWLGRLVKLEEKWPGRHVKLAEGGPADMWNNSRGKMAGATWETRGKMAGPTWETRGKMAGPTWETRGKMAGPTWETRGKMAWPSCETPPHGDFYGTLKGVRGKGAAQRPNPKKKHLKSTTFTMGNTMPESTLTLCQSRLYPPVRDLGFGLSWSDQARLQRRAITFCLSFNPPTCKKGSTIHLSAALLHIWFVE